MWYAVEGEGTARSLVTNMVDYHKNFIYYMIFCLANYSPEQYSVHRLTRTCMKFVISHVIP